MVLKKIAVVISLLSFLCFSFPAVSMAGEAPYTENQLEAFLDEAEASFSEVRSVKTYITQEKNISIFNERVISRGLCLFKAPESLRLEFTEPFKSVLIIDDGEVFKYEYFENGWQRLSPGNREVMLIVMRNITSWLKGKFRDPNLYRISAYKDQNTRLVLEPKHDQFKKFISSFELGINKEKNGLDYIIIHEKDDDYTKIIFERSVTNGDIKDLCFSGKGSAPQPVEPW